MKNALFLIPITLLWLGCKKQNVDQAIPTPPETPPVNMRPKTILTVYENSNRKDSAAITFDKNYIDGIGIIYVLYVDSNSNGYTWQKWCDFNANGDTVFISDVSLKINNGKETTENENSYFYKNGKISKIAGWGNGIDSGFADSVKYFYDKENQPLYYIVTSRVLSGGNIPLLVRDSVAIENTSSPYFGITFTDYSFDTTTKVYSKSSIVSFSFDQTNLLSVKTTQSFNNGLGSDILIDSTRYSKISGVLPEFSYVDWGFNGPVFLLELAQLGLNNVALSTSKTNNSTHQTISSTSSDIITDNYGRISQITTYSIANGVKTKSNTQTYLY